MGASGQDEGDLLTSIELCAGAGGQAIGLHRAGFRHLALVEIDNHAYRTLKANTSDAEGWENCEVLNEDLIDEFDPLRPMKALGGRNLKPGELDLLSGGVPCPPFSVAGDQLGPDDERDLFPRMLRIIEQLHPRAIMIENVRGIMESKFDAYRNSIISKLRSKGYWFCGWHLLQADNYGVPQLRPRSVLVAIKDRDRRKAGLSDDQFPWPVGMLGPRRTVFAALDESMQKRRNDLADLFPERRKEVKEAYDLWCEKASKRNEVGPTLVGGSKKHGGADLGPSRAKKAWADFGINALGVADKPEDSETPDRDFLRSEGPMLTVEQAAVIQSFPECWTFEGGKTAQYRQVGNAFPPPVAEAVGRAIFSVLEPERKKDHLKGLKIELLGVRSSEQQYAQQERIEVVVVSDRSIDLATTDDLGGDLVGANV